MTLQEMFNIVWNGLKGQNWQQCTDARGNCVYRGPNGMKCAAGHVFTDGDIAEAEKKAFELGNTKGLISAGVYTVASLCGRTDLPLDALGTMQGMHDLYLSPGQRMETRFRDYAKAHKLTIPE